jgi:hypothetical protein
MPCITCKAPCPEDQYFGEAGPLCDACFVERGLEYEAAVAELTRIFDGFVDDDLSTLMPSENVNHG